MSIMTYTVQTGNNGLCYSCFKKTLSLSNANNNSWICRQRVPVAVRRLRITRFFVICVTTTSVVKIVILKNTLDHGRNIDPLYVRYYKTGIQPIHLHSFYFNYPKCWHWYERFLTGMSNSRNFPLNNCSSMRFRFGLRYSFSTSISFLRPWSYDKTCLKFSS
jgi:hypothetical protein